METDDQLLNSFVNELREKHKCHTAILYGSRARGDFTELSDYDLMGIRTDGEKFRDARLVDGSYLDLFIWPESELQQVNESHLYMKDGIVLFEKDAYGSGLLKKLKELHKNKPEGIPDYEKSVRKVWFRKMIDRARVGDTEGNYRGVWLLYGCLEDYFLMRDLRYEGSKASLAWLKEHDPKSASLFDAALRSPNNMILVERLAKKVYLNEEEQVTQTNKAIESVLQPTLETQRLVLEPYKETDLNDILKYASRPEVSKYVPWESHKTIEDSKKFLEYIRGSTSTTRERLFYVFAIRLKETGHVIGSFDFKNVNPKCGQIDYAIGYDYWNKGIVTEAADAVKKWALTSLPEMIRFQAFCAVENKGSARVMEKIGMQREGVRRKAFVLKGTPVDLVDYALVR